MLRRIRICTLVALPLLLPVSLVAQILSDSVPREFVEVFLGAGPGRSEMHVGGLPSDIEAALPLLPDGRVVGATRTSYGSTLAVIAFEAAPDDVLRRFEAALTAEGWDRAPPREERGGFVSSNTPAFNVWCSTAFGVQPSVRWQNDLSYLRISFNDRARSPCDTAERMRAPRIAYGIDLPTLPAPPGVDQRGGGTGGSDGKVDSSAQLQGPVPPAVLAAHYAVQLEAAGWTPLEALDGAGVSVRRYTAPGRDGTSWQGLLILWQGGDGIVFATVEATRAEPL